MYDTVIIGAGPAGISAAMNLKLHNKKFLWLGSADLSDKVQKSEKIANYPGAGLISGKELNARLKDHANELGIEVEDKMVTAITKTSKAYMVLAGNEIYETKTVLLTTGVVMSKGFAGEKELLGKGVSYCGTCDGFLYKEKTLAVHCQTAKFEHEVAYLAELASKLYVFRPYKGQDLGLANVEYLDKPFKEIKGADRVEAVVLADGREIAVDGSFIFRNSVAPDALLPGLILEGAHIKVDRSQATNYAGCFAAGDCTGRPYQIAKAVGEGNVAAHSILEYLAQLEK